MAESTKRNVRLEDRLALTIPEAAEVIGVSERHIRSLIPEIPHCHVGGRVVVPVSLLEGWLCKQVEMEKNGVEKTVSEILDGIQSSE